MSHYRKIDVRVWNDSKFRALDHAAKLVFFMLLSHPAMTMLGAMRATTAGLAEEMAMSLEAFREAFGLVLQQGMAEQDTAAHFIALPNFLRYNQPASPNVVKSWASALDMLPECALKTRVIARSKAFAEGMSKGFAEALPEAFRKTYPNQEQEQEQEQEYSGACAPARPAAERALAPDRQAIDQQPARGLPADAFQFNDSDRYGIPGRQTAEQMESELWDAGKSLLIGAGVAKAHAGSFIGGLLAKSSREIVVEVVRAAIVERPVEPKAWMTKACADRMRSMATMAALKNQGESLSTRRARARAEMFGDDDSANDTALDAVERVV